MTERGVSLKCKQARTIRIALYDCVVYKYADSFQFRLRSRKRKQPESGKRDVISPCLLGTRLMMNARLTAAKC